MNYFLLDPQPSTSNEAQEPQKYVDDNKLIPANEISESYLPKKYSQRPNSAPNSTKGVRRIFAPSFLLRRKKNQDSSKHDYVNINELNEEDLNDIACYEDLVAEQQSINPVMLAQLDDSQINNIELDRYERFYKNRLDFVLNNYRQPPPYPGNKAKKQIPVETTSKTNSKPTTDTPFINQLLNDKQLNDNASMNNFWQASPKHKQFNQPLSQKESQTHQMSTDKLVSRTHDLVKKSAILNENKVNANELYEKRKQYYMDNFNHLKEENNYMNNQRDTISEIIYPEKDYDLENHNSNKGMSMSASVPNLSSKQQGSEQNLQRNFPSRQPRGEYTCFF